MIANCALGFLVLVMLAVFIDSLCMMFGVCRRDAYGGGGTSA